MGRIIDRRRVMGGKLPYDAEIEYIQFEKYQYIHLPVRISSNLISEINCTIDSINGKFILWNRYQRTNPQYSYSLAFNQSYENNRLRVDYGSSRNVSHQNYLDIKDFIGNAHIVFGNGNLIFNGTELVLNNSTQVFTSPLDYYTIGIENPDSNADGTWKLLHLSISEDDILIFDLSPVRVGTTGYLYDKVSGQLFGNSGTGAFILGPDK